MQQRLRGPVKRCARGRYQPSRMLIAGQSWGSPLVGDLGLQRAPSSRRTEGGMHGASTENLEAANDDTMARNKSAG
jgi:hypothetical protein